MNNFNHWEQGVVMLHRSPVYEAGLKTSSPCIITERRWISSCLTGAQGTKPIANFPRHYPNSSKAQNLFLL